MPTRGDVAFLEATRDPVFLFQWRHWIINQEGLPSEVVFCPSAMELLYTDPEDPNDRFLSIDDFAEEFSDRVTPVWHTERVYFTREEAEAYGKARSYNYTSGWRVYCVPAQGDLAEILQQHSLAPTGVLKSL